MGFRGSNGTSHKTKKYKGRWGKGKNYPRASKVVTYHISEIEKEGSSEVKSAKDRILKVQLKQE